MSAGEHTFLFCDLVGFTALTDSEGDERAAAVAAALQLRVRELTAEHGGEVVKQMGDAAMVRCSDAAATVELALRLVQRVEADPILPPVRVGIHSGTAVASRT
jgi:adenylate cyclase